MEVEEYVRTRNGLIFKVTGYWLGELAEEIKENIKAHSKNIIDLIEVGDYVNGILINYTPKDEHKIYHDAYDMYDVYAFSNKDIETILTHEMYEQNCYKVGEE